MAIFSKNPSLFQSIGLKYKLSRYAFYATLFQYRHGGRWFQTVVSFSIEKLIVEQCTWRYTAQQRWYHAEAMFCQVAKLVYSDRHGHLSEYEISMSIVVPSLRRSLTSRMSILLAIVSLASSLSRSSRTAMKSTGISSTYSRKSCEQASFVRRPAIKSQ